MTTIEIIGAPQSVYVRTTRMALEEKGVAYILTPAAPLSPEILAIHPFGKIPAMRYGDFELFESRAIAGYVDCVFPGPKLMPDDAKRAAKAEQWISAINTSVFPALIGYMQANAFPKGTDGKPDRAIVEGFLPAVRNHIGILNRAVAQCSHLSGAGFSLADMYLMPILAYLRMFPESGAAMNSAPALSSYFDRHARRDSFEKTVPPPMSELRR